MFASASDILGTAGFHCAGNIPGCVPHGLFSMDLNLLLVDDDTEYSHLLHNVLQQHGIAVVMAGSGRQAIEELARKEFDLIFLDVTMPVMDGMVTLQRLRREMDTPVIMLTSRIASVDRVQGLDFGADDYVCKPCDPDELLSRIRAVLRRTKKATTASESYYFGADRFDAMSRELTCEGQQVRLTSLEAELLFMLLKAGGKPTSREAIALVLQDRALDVFDRSLDVHISRLRSKLGHDAGAIQTVRGTGFLRSALGMAERTGPLRQSDAKSPGLTSAHDSLRQW